MPSFDLPGAGLGNEVGASAHLESAVAQGDHDEAAFHEWNSRLSAEYGEAHPEADASASHPLYRATRDNPEDIFQAGASMGAMKSSDGKERTFNLEVHQLGTSPSAYVSTSRSLKVAEDYNRRLGREYAYVIDPSPHGVDLNARHWNGDVSNQSHSPSSLRGKVGSIVDRDYQLKHATPYKGGNYFHQQEVAIPGKIPTEDIRGVLHFDPTKNGLDYGSLQPNPHYMSPARHLEEYGRSIDQQDEKVGATEQK